MPTEEFYAGQSNYIRKLNDLWDRATTSVFGTSTDSLSVTTGSKSFTTNTNLQFVAGSQVTITATADLSKYMSGQVTAYTQSTGAITVNVGSVNGSGTFSSWSITLSGAAGATGAAGIADNISIGTVTSGAAAASITGTSPNKFLNLTLEQGATGLTGATGATGAPNILSIGSVTSSGTASATITGTSPAQVLNLVLPKGDTGLTGATGDTGATGAPNVLTIGTVTSGASPDVTITGTSPSQTLNFVLQKGDTGNTGATGATGAKGLYAQGVWNSAAAYVVDDWVTYNGSSYYRKVAGTTATDPATDTTNWGILAQKGADGTGAVSSVTATSPIFSSGGANPNITIQVANTTQGGYLTAADWNTFNGKGNGTVTTASVASANGFAGTVATATSTPIITISTSVAGVLKGDGTSLSAATAGTDYSVGTSALTTGILKSTTTTGALSIAVAADFPVLNQNTTGTAANVTGTVAVANGGTGSTSLTAGGVVVGNGTSAVSLVAPSTSGNVLTSNGSTWVSSAPAGGSTTLTFNVSTTGYGEETVLPDATTLTVGATRSYRNSGEFERIVKDSGGGILGFIPPFSTARVVLEDNTSADGIWQVEGMNNLGITAEGYNLTSGTTESLAGANVLVIDTDRIFFTYTAGGTLYGVVYNNSTKIWGSHTALRTGTSLLCKSVLQTTDKIVLVSCPSTTTSMQTVVLSLTGTSISIGTPVTTTLAGNISSFGEIFLNVSTIFVSYLRATTSGFRVITVSGTTPSVGSEVTVSGTGAAARFYDITSSVVLCTSSTATNIYAGAYTISGTTATLGTEINTAATSAIYRSIKMPTGRVAIIFLNTTAVGGFVTVSGTTPSLSTASLGTATAPLTTGADVAVISSTKVLYAGSIAATTWNINILSDTSGTASAGTEITLATIGPPIPFISKVSTTFATVALQVNANNTPEFSCRIDISTASPSFNYISKSTQYIAGTSGNAGVSSNATPSSANNSLLSANIFQSGTGTISASLGTQYSQSKMYGDKNRLNTNSIQIDFVTALRGRTNKESWVISSASQGFFRAYKLESIK